MAPVGKPSGVDVASSAASYRSFPAKIEEWLERNDGKESVVMSPSKRPMSAQRPPFAVQLDRPLHLVSCQPSAAALGAASVGATLRSSAG
jgi:hypothetical protein